jgi:hypothetical protein
MRYTIIFAALLLAGCSTSPKWLETRVVCTVDNAEAHALSKWALFSIGSKLATADAAVICKR